MKTRFPDYVNNTIHNCIIHLTYAYEGGKPLLALQSKPFIYPSNAKAKTGKHTGKGGSKSKTLVWVIPVALVLAACLLGLALMVYKYRRLQHSFLAFAARSSYTRQENDFDDDDDDNMVVGFRSGRFRFALDFVMFLGNQILSSSFLHKGNIYCPHHEECKGKPKIG